MPAKLEMKLDKRALIAPQMASSFHGVLMELISAEYADILHMSKLHPYTQHIEKRDDGWYWVVTTLNDEAKTELIDNTLLRTDGIYLNRHQLSIGICERRYTEISSRELAEAFYQGQAERYITVRFITATAFKVNGSYINYPDIWSMYSSLMHKYSAASDTETMQDEDTLEQITADTTMGRYELKSCLFPLEGTKIPAFTGIVTYKLHGTQTMCNFVDMLFRFGSYASVGIKTALGMGAIEILPHFPDRHAGRQM